MTDKTCKNPTLKSRSTGPCEVVTAYFVYGSQTCGVVTTKKVRGAYPDEFHYICSQHYKEYKQNGKGR